MERKKGISQGSLLTPRKSISSFTYSTLTVFGCLSGAMINESDGVPVFI